MRDIEIVRNAVKNIVEGQYYSKVTTNRNWVICLRTLENGPRCVFDACKFGDAGRMCDTFEDIQKYDIKYFFFTYKKDFVKMLKALNESGNYRFLAGKGYL